MTLYYKIKGDYQYNYNNDEDETQDEDDPYQESMDQAKYGLLTK